ncbi:MAG TPA: ABC transporter permease [Gemmatimonadaceae bacterium]|nr:ABC transporter permease [Gemmatimonadaceae bacterium]
MTRADTAAPPRIAEWLVAIASPANDRRFVLSDFRDAFDERVHRDGIRAARAWYWGEAVRSIVPLVARRLSRRDASDAPTSRARWSDAMVDVRYALRLSRRSPLASIAIVSTMTLGIAATVAVFSATEGVLLRPLPFPESDRVVQLETVVRGQQVAPTVAYPDAMDFRRLVPDFSDITLFARGDVTLQHGVDPQNPRALEVDDAYARVFALRPALGRLLTATDSSSSAPKVAVLSYDFWMREFGGDRALVGRTIRIDNEPVTVVGVLAEDSYVFPRESVDLLLPLGILSTSFRKNRGALWATAAAKLKPHASFQQAQRDLASVAALLAVQFANSNHDLSARIVPLREAVVGSVRPMLELLAAAIAAVLLIACINIANLVLGRAQARTREFALRSALGGTPSRVRRQVFTESLVLAAIGGVLGLLIAPVLTHFLVAIYPDALPRADEIGIGMPVVFVAVIVTVAAAVCSAIPTARRIVRPNLTDDLRGGSRSSGHRGERRTGRVLIVMQVAGSLALLFSAGLLGQTFWRLERVDPGFDSRHTLTFHTYPSRERHFSGAAIEHYYSEVTTALRALPGVTSVSTTTLLPFGGCCFLDTFIQEDRGDQGAKNPQAFISVDAPGFERALGIPLLRGRSFTAQDDSSAEHVVMLNAEAARRMYPGRDPIGQRINWNGQPHWRVVGVLASTHLESLSDEMGPVLYVPATQAPRRWRYVVIRTTASEKVIIAGARTALRAIDPTVALTDIATMDQRVARSLGAQRFRAALMATLGALALALAVIGIYGVVAYSVSRRTIEIGIRMALGEAAHDVRRRVVVDALRVAAIGIAIGAALALLSGKWLAVFLVGVNPYDGRLLFAASALLTALVIATAYGPARRAARVDPMTALRAD